MVLREAPATSCNLLVPERHRQTYTTSMYGQSPGLLAHTQRLTCETYTHGSGLTAPSSVNTIRASVQVSPLPHDHKHFYLEWKTVFDVANELLHIAARLLCPLPHAVPALWICERRRPWCSMNRILYGAP